MNTEVLFGLEDNGILTAIEVAERLSYVLAQEIERMQAQLKEGMF